jgi:hypothetical protein
MKKLMLISTMLLICYFSEAQYSMTTKMEAYQELDNPTSVNLDEVWNEGSNYQVYFNFDFQIYGQTYTALNVIAGGGISFPGLGEKQLFVYHTPFGGYLLKDKGETNSISEINYEINGEAGQRILKIEWKNAGFVQWFTISDPTDYVDMQIWLIESDNHIEIHFGDNQTAPSTYGYPEATSDSNPGPSIKFWFDSCDNVLCLTGAANLPSYNFYSICNPNYYFVDGTPSNGIIYSFIPTGSGGVQEFVSEKISVYPNPFTEQITITFSDEQINTVIKLLDLNGKAIRVLNISGIEYKIERGDLTAGIYFLQINNGKNIITKKVILQ